MGGGRKRRKKIVGGETGGWVPPVEALTKSLTVHPSGSHVVLLAGNRLIGFNFRNQEVFEVGGVSQPIRVATFSPCGRWLLAGGDDKCFRVWKVGTWDSCTNAFEIQKKACSGAFTMDGSYCIVGDKFGDVHCGVVDPTTDHPECALLLGHYCSTLTSISIPQGSDTVVTTDRDNKVRCSNLPPNPLEGSYDIKAYCLGHSAFVTSSSFAVWDNQEVLITGGGDGQVIIWKYETGYMLAKYQVPAVDQRRSPADTNELPEKMHEEATVAFEPSDGNPKQAEYGANLRIKGKTQMESGNVILSLSPAHANPYIALVLEGCSDVWILECSMPTYKMTLRQKFTSPRVPSPISVLFDLEEKLWLVGGPTNLESNEVHLAIARKQGNDNFECCSYDVIPKAALDKLECRCENSMAIDQSPNIACISQILGKREYMDLENRKKLRADMKEKKMLSERCDSDEGTE